MVQESPDSSPLMGNSVSVLAEQILHQIQHLQNQIYQSVLWLLIWEQYGLHTQGYPGKYIIKAGT